MNWLTRNAFIVALLTVAVLTYTAQNTFRVRYVDAVQTEQRGLVSERLSNVRFQLESMLTRDLSLLNGLAAFISTNPNFTEDQFVSYARAVLEQEASLINLAAAPDLVVRYVYPLAGNEEVLGLNYRDVPDQRAVVERVASTGQMLIAGPLELVQGIEAVIGRAPVYVTEAGQTRLWGIVSGPMRLSDLYGRAGLLDPELGLRLAIRGRDGLGARGELIFGDASVFEDESRVSMPINLGGGSWEISAVPMDDALANNMVVLVARVLALAVIAVLLLLMLIARRQSNREEAYRRIIFRSERFLRAVETVSRVGGWRLDDRLCFSELSDQACRIMGIPPATGVSNLEDFCAELDSASAIDMQRLFAQAFQDRSRVDTALKLRRRDGDIQWLQIRADFLNHDQRHPELIGAIQDISQAKNAESLIEYQANYDVLTGLPNRTLFRDRLETALLFARRHNTQLAVMFIDLDNFKSVNDNLGHDAGDALLVEMSQRIRQCIRESDTVARYSGDEFVALLTDAPESAVSRIAAKMTEEMSLPFHPAGRQVYCTVSIGVAICPADGDDVETLIIKADQAMYEVKKGGRNGWQFYTAQMQKESEQRHNLYNDLLDALNAQQLEVYYQPIIDANSLRIVSCEALARWRREDGQWESPDDFISVAEERGIINRVDHFVLERASSFIGELNASLEVDVGLSVNVSSRLLYLSDPVAQQWLSCVRDSRHVRLTIEITERLLVEDANRARRVLEELQQEGVSISIDDFGTGYSGLSYFSHFPVTSMKIDRSFVNAIGHSSTEEALVESMLLMAKKLNVQVVAEGVETEEQLAFLQRYKCDYVQGYLIARPMPGEELLNFVRENLTAEACA